MESSIDGDIKLSVGVDTKEAEGDIKKIGKSVENILKAIEKGTNDLSSRFDTLNNSVVNIAASLDEMKKYITGVSTVKLPAEQLNRIIESISNVNGQVASTNQEVEKANESAVEFSSTVAKMGQTKINFGVEDLQSQFEEAKAEYEITKKNFERAKSSGEISSTNMQELDLLAAEAAENYERLQKAVAITQTTMTSFDNSTSEVSSKMLGLQESVNKSESAVIALEQKLAQMHTIPVPTEEFSELSKELQQLEEFKSLNPQGEYLKKIETDISNVQKNIAELYRNGKAFQDVTRTTGYQHLVNQLQVANGKLTGARQKLEERTQAENQDTEAINRNTEAIERNNRARNGGTGGGDTDREENRLSRIANIVGRATSRIGKFTSVLSGYFSKLSKFVNRSNKDVDKNFKNINKTIRRSITNVLKYALGIRSIYFAFNKIRRAGIESFKNLAKSSDEVNKTISKTYSAFVNLKNAMGPAFQPLVSALAPVFTRLADSLTNATYRLGEFFAALTGQSYIYKAIKVQKDYAKSLDKTSDKLQENLASFDKLNVLSDKNDTSEDDSVQYETTPLSDTFSTLKSLIESQDWDGLGYYIAQKINGAVQKINTAVSWENVGEKITGTVTAFTTTINSMVDNIDWALLGDTVGEGVNTIVNTLNLLLTGVNFRKIGQSLATGLNKAVTTINWNNLGKMLGNWFMKSWKIFLGFVERLDFKVLGKAVADGINGFFTTFDLSAIASSISTFINGISDMLLTFVQETDWGKIVDNITGGINTFLRDTDWKKAGESLSKTISTLLDTLIEIVGDTDWQAFGSAVMDFIIGIDWGSLFNNLFKAIGVILGGIEGIIVGIFKSLTKAQENFWDKQFAETGGNIGLGILHGIRDIFVGIGKWIWNNIFKPFYDGVCDAFGIHSPAKEMVGIGENIILGLLNGLKDKFVALWDWIKSLPKKFKDGFLEVADAIKQPFAHIADWFKNVFQKAWQGVKDVFSTGGKVFDGIKEGIISEFKNVVNMLIRGINTIVSMPFNNINGILNGVRQIPGFGFIPENPLPIPQIPELATGTVVPTNFGKFPAILGDNTREPEVVSPVSTIEQALENVLKRKGFFGDGNIEINLNVDGKTVYNVVVNYDQIEKKRHGGRSRLGTV